MRFERTPASREVIRLGLKIEITTTENEEASFPQCPLWYSFPENRTARALLHGPPGGLFGIDQEVVTLRGLYGNSGFCNRTPGAT